MKKKELPRETFYCCSIQDSLITLEELPVFDDLNELYNRVQLIFEAEFAELSYDQVNEYNYASSHTLKYLRISYRLLQLATSLPDKSIKFWSLITENSHSILHVPSSGVTAMYHLLKRALPLDLRVPNNLTGGEPVFIRLTDLQDLYFGYNKRNLRNTIFKVEKFESEGLCTIRVSSTNRRPYDQHFFRKDCAKFCP